MSKKIGVIAEDNSDIEVVIEILAKYLIRNTFSVKKFVGNGCGKVKQKCDSWSKLLFKSGCEHVFLFHDLDKNKEAKLRKLLELKLPPNDNPNTLIVIPVEELEAWLLSDVDAIQKTFSLSKTPKKIDECEIVASPKEHLTKMIWHSDKKRYVNTIHNKKICEKTSLENLRRCSSFSGIDKYIKDKLLVTIDLK